MKERPGSAPLDPSTGQPSLPRPTAEDLLAGLFELGRDLHLETSEAEIARRFLALFSDLFPGRRFAIRVLDPRSADRARIYPGEGEIRRGLETERLMLKRSSVEKTRLKTAVAESAWVRLGDRWDSPFVGISNGFAVPLVASGELYGLLDVGYPDVATGGAADEALILPLANHLSVSLRNERLHHDTTGLRDYQSRLIEHANALILGVDAGWRITVCNKALCQLTGYTSAEVVGRDLRDWLHEEERPRLVETFRAALGGTHADAVEAELQTRSGERVRTVWSVAAVGSRKSVQSVVAIGQDQTKLRELQGHLIQAEKLATIGQLAAGVVHELNNPLTSISIYAEYLLKKKQGTARASDVDDEGDRDKLRKIAAAASRIMHFARDLVQYAKPAAAASERSSLATVVRQGLSFCEHLFESAEVELSARLDDELPAIEAVRGRLEQVVINLVTNAVQAGARTIVIETFVAGPSEVGFSVSDSGPGIPAADRDRIFEPFFTTKSEGRGTGLGLSIVANIVEQHRGRIRVESSDLGGAELVVTLPIAPAR